MKFQQDINKNKKGFAMLFAVLTASLLLTIGLSIFNISFKELLISTNARESQIAFFAADSARECALYWDVKHGAFQACLDVGCSSKTPPFVGNIYCNSNQAQMASTTDPFNEKITHRNTLNTSFFVYDSSNTLEPEAKIDIIKQFNVSSSSITTTITARGYNTQVIDRRLERAIVQRSQ